MQRLTKSLTTKSLEASEFWRWLVFLLTWFAVSDKLIRVDKSVTTSKSATVYIKGFLQPGKDGNTCIMCVLMFFIGESPQKFNYWHECHQNLEKRFHWSPRVYGYYWQSGSIIGLGQQY